MDRKTLRNGFATGALLTMGVSAIAWAQKSNGRSEAPAVVANGPMSLEAFENGEFKPIVPTDPVSRSPHDLKPATHDAHVVLAHSTSPLPPPALPPVPAAPTIADALLLPSLNRDPQSAANEPVSPLLPAPDDPNLVDAATNRRSQRATASRSEPPPVGTRDANDDSIASVDQTDPDVFRLPTIGLGRLAQDFEGDERVDDSAIDTDGSKTVADGSAPVFSLKPVPAVSPLTGPRDQWNNEIFREEVVGDDVSHNDAALAILPPPAPEFAPNVDPAVDLGTTNAPPPHEYDHPAMPPAPTADQFDTMLPPPTEPAIVEGEEPFSATWNTNPFETPQFNDGLLNQFGDRFARFQGSDDDLLAPTMPLSAKTLAAWWSDTVDDPLRPSKPSLPVDVNTLVLTALSNSPDVLAFQLEPEIRRKGICEEQAAFDWTAFTEVTYDDVSDPVGNTLTTGGANRFQDRILSGTSGLRQKNTHGGEFEVNQRFGYQDNNSDFFVPKPQGTSRLTLSYTQPLLSQRGEAYQQSRTVLAMLETGAAEDDTADRIQDHLLSVTEAYWELYRARALYLQRRNLLGEAERILATLEGRSNMDTVPRQLLRAKSAVLLRRSEITRAAMDIRNGESRLRLLVGDPQMTSGMPLELLPTEHPVVNALPISVADAARTAIAHRPDVRRSVKKVRSTGVRVGVTENELMPRLDLVFNGYLSGLEGGGQIARSFGDQFTEGRPSFAAGLLFEIPLGNRAAKARHHRRQLEMVQATHELESVVERGLTEVEMAVRELDTSHREMANRYESMRAAGEEMDYLRDRWNLLPGGSSTTQLLEDLLDAQERLADDEGAFVTAQVNYVLAVAALQRAMGMLMKIDEPGCPLSPLSHDVVPIDPGPQPTLSPPFEAETGP